MTENTDPWIDITWKLIAIRDHGCFESEYLFKPDKDLNAVPEWRWIESGERLDEFWEKEGLRYIHISEGNT